MPPQPPSVQRDGAGAVFLMVFPWNPDPPYFCRLYVIPAVFSSPLPKKSISAVSDAKRHFFCLPAVYPPKRQGRSLPLSAIPWPRLGKKRHGRGYFPDYWAHYLQTALKSEGYPWRKKSAAKPCGSAIPPPSSPAPTSAANRRGRVPLPITLTSSARTASSGKRPGRRRSLPCRSGFSTAP